MTPDTKKQRVKRRRQKNIFMDNNMEICLNGGRYPINMEEKFR